MRQVQRAKLIKISERVRVDLIQRVATQVERVQFVEIVIECLVFDRHDEVLLQFEHLEPGEAAKTVLSQRTDLVFGQGQAFQSDATEAVVVNVHNVVVLHFEGAQTLDLR